MEVFGSRVLFAPALTLRALAFVLGGAVLGTVSGLTPGIHVNNVALLLASIAAQLPGPPRLVGAAILAAGVVHSFLDVIPALALGVPDASMAVTALPGHRLVIAGQGREAVRLSALGSGLAVAFAVPLAVPITTLMTTAYPILVEHLSVVLALVVVFLVVTEPTLRAAAGGVVAFTASATLGYVALDLSVDAVFPTGDVLLPLFAGLFGVPIVLDALGGAGVPPQAESTVTTSKSAVVGTALAGTVAGAIVGYVPGVSSAIAAVVSLTALPGRSGARGFIVATSGVNTANTVFALFALVSLGTPRTGVMVALNEANAPLDLPLLLTSVGIASAIGFSFVLLVGDWYLRTVGRMNYTRLSVCVLALLTGLVVLFAGAVGVGILVVSAIVGLIPTRAGTRRVHLMGVLIGPLIVGV